MDTARQKKTIGVRLDTAISGTLMGTETPVWITSVTAKAESVRPGDAYVALPTAADREHRDAMIAVQNGAVVVIAERYLPLAGVHQFIADDTAQAFGQLCHALVGNPSKQLPIVGVAGAVGKSSTSRLLASVLGCGTRPTAWHTSDSHFDGQRKVASRTPARAAGIASWAARSAANHQSHAVIECDQRTMADKQLSGTSLSAICLTSLRGMSQTFEQLTRLAADASVVIANADDDDCCRWISELNQPVVTYGWQKPADVTAVMLESHTSEQVFLVAYGTESAVVRITLPSQGQAENSLAAIAAGLALGVDLATAVSGVASVAQLPGVLRSLACGQDFSVLLDRPKTSLALCNAQRLLNEQAKGRRITVIANEVGNDLRADSCDYAGMIAAATAMGDLVITTDEIAQRLPSTVRESDKLRVLEDRFASIALSIALAEEGDAVLIAGETDLPAATNKVGDASNEQIARELIALRLEQAKPYAAAG